MTERRLHRRYPYSDDAEIVLEGEHYTCVVLNISAGGAAFSSTWRPEVGTRISVRLDDIEPMEAEVTRHLNEGFAIAFDLTGENGATIADQLNYLSDKRQFLG